MRRILAISGSLMLLAIGGVAAVVVIAGLYTSEGERIVLEWMYANEDGPPDWAWDEAHRFLWLASHLDPLDPRAYTNTGKLYELKARKEARRGEQTAAAFEVAVNHYRRAVALRPAWPYGWADLAMVKLEQGRFDGELALAMERATTLGPWEPGVQLSIASRGLNAWDELPDNLRGIVRLTVERGIERDWKPIVALAKQLDLKETDEGH